MSAPAEPPHAQEPSVRAPELTVATSTFVAWGIGAWLLVLATLLLVPGVRDGDRSWWVWVPVAGALLGVLGYAYLRSGRGSAAQSEQE